MNAPSADAIRAGTITITGHGGDEIEAYQAVPLALGIARRRHGSTACPDTTGRPGVRPPARRQRLQRARAEPLLAGSAGCRARRCGRRGAGPAGCPTTIGRRRRGRGGAPARVGRRQRKVQCHRALPDGRQAYLAACSLPVDAAVDCYGAWLVEDPPEGMPKAMKPILDLAPISAVRCSAYSASTTASRPPPRWQRWTPSSTGWTSRTSSTRTRARAIRSSRSTGRRTGRRPRWTAGDASTSSSPPT